MTQLLSLATFFTGFAQMAVAGDAHVNGYYRSNGTYVQPHMRSAPDNNPYNNYSTQGNVNPYTGQQGTVNPYNNGANTLNTGSSYGGANTIGCNQLNSYNCR